MSRRRIVKRFAGVAAALIVMLIVVGAYASYQWSRLVITIRHQGLANVPATDVELSVHGDRAIVEQLRRGEKRTGPISAVMPPTSSALASASQIGS